MRAMCICTQTDTSPAEKKRLVDTYLDVVGNRESRLKLVYRGKMQKALKLGQFHDWSQDIDVSRLMNLIHKLSRKGKTLSSTSVERLAFTRRLLTRVRGWTSKVRAIFRIEDGCLLADLQALLKESELIIPFITCKEKKQLILVIKQTLAWTHKAKDLLGHRSVVRLDVQNVLDEASQLSPRVFTDEGKPLLYKYICRVPQLINHMHAHAQNAISAVVYRLLNNLLHTLDVPSLLYVPVIGIVIAKTTRNIR